MFDLSRTWTLPDLWTSDDYWNVARDPAAADVAVVVVVLGLVWFALKTRKGR